MTDPSLQPEESSGVWLHHGAPASVDWCEANYIYTDWIAEFWNTLSSAPMLFLGLFALWRLRRSHWQTAPRFALCFAGLALVGLGSMAFHATLLQSAQALDELPMVYCSLVMTYCVVIRKHDPNHDRQSIRRWQMAFSSYALAFTLVYFNSPDYFALFIASFAGVVTYLVIQGWRVVFRERRSRPLRNLYIVAATAFVSGVALFWLPERHLGCDHKLQALHLHAWWHLLAMVGTYVGFLLVLYEHLLTTKRAPQLHTGALPWVTPEC